MAAAAAAIQGRPVALAAPVALFFVQRHRFVSLVLAAALLGLRDFGPVAGSMCHQNVFVFPCVAKRTVLCSSSWYAAFVICPAAAVSPRGFQAALRQTRINSVPLCSGMPRPVQVPLPRDGEAQAPLPRDGQEQRCQMAARLGVDDLVVLPRTHQVVRTELHLAPTVVNEFKIDIFTERLMGALVEGVVVEAQGDVLKQWCDHYYYPERRIWYDLIHTRDRCLMFAEEFARRGEFFFYQWFDAGRPSDFVYNEEEHIAVYNGGEEFVHQFNHFNLRNGSTYNRMSLEAALLIRSTRPFTS